VEDEGVLYEGLRLGSRQAFAELLAHVDPTMRRLGLQHVRAEQVAPLVRTTWAVALPGLDMFSWHTTLRAWLTGIFVTYARAAAVEAPVPAAVTGAVAVPDRAAGGDVPWETLGWSRWWPAEHWAAFDGALAARPLAEREVLWLHDVEGWSWRETLDCLGLTAEQGQRLRSAAREQLAARVARLIGAGPEVAGEHERRLEGVSRLLGALQDGRRTEPGPAAGADADLQRLFTAWRRRRAVPAWRRVVWDLGHRGPRSA
jgi:DNA-directed RNA polymerase specialized sigma24 family protein